MREEIPAQITEGTPIDERFARRSLVGRWFSRREKVAEAEKLAQACEESARSAHEELSGKSGSPAELRERRTRVTSVVQTARREARRARVWGRKAATKIEEKPRRITVDLDMDRYQVLREFAFEERTKGTEVLRGLLDILRDDPELSNVRQ